MNHSFWLLIRYAQCVIAMAFIFSAQAYALEKVYSLEDDLIYRINFGRVEDVQILLEKGANPNAASVTGEYAISIAIGRDDNQSGPIVQLLLDKGANPNVYDSSGIYPIVNAVLNNKVDSVNSLIAKGANYHVKSPSGRTLLEIAQANKNQEIIKILQDKFNKEAEEEANQHSPDKFRRIIHHYAFDSCIYQYWNFVLGSRQIPDQDSLIHSQIDHAKTDIFNLIGQIQKDYPSTPQADLQRVSNDAAQQIYSILDAMVSNNNRKEHGVGQESDANSRCQKIGDSTNFDFAPSATK